ncbi:MAG TPA: hypothetical protein VKB37_02255, partial [Jatrophihabitantaceae bacterium]|nr:hypothetical protein [Jatrophihabitantaceae bacterium]
MTATLSPPATEVRAAPAATASRARTLRHAFALARRNLIKTRRTPEQLIDVTIQPIIFLLLFV